jgi:glycosyltransferase involved in cell wall biosynthesis
MLSSSLGDRFDLRPYNIGRPPKPAVHNNFGYSVLWNAGVRRMFVGIAITLRHLLLFPLELLRFRPAIVHIHTAPYWVFWETTFYVAACKVFRIPCALQLHYSFRLFYSSCSRIPRRLVLWVLHLATVFVVICKDDQQFLKGIGATRIRSTYLPNCVDVQGLQLSSGEFLRARKRGGDLEVLFLGGSDTKRKGLPELLKAIPAIAQRFPEVRFRLVAVPPDLVASVLPSEHLGRCLIEGWVAGRDKTERLARADLFVLPTHGEGMPIAILEAMAAGLPIVATEVAGIPDMVRNEQEGLLIPLGDVPALAEAIMRLFRSPDLRNAMGRRAAKRVMQEYDLSRGVENWEHLYRSLLKNTSSAQ